MQPKPKMRLFSAAILKSFSFNDLRPRNSTSRTLVKSRGGQRFMQKDVHLNILYKSKKLHTTQRLGGRRSGKKLRYHYLLQQFATHLKENPLQRVLFM